MKVLNDQKANFFTKFKNFSKNLFVNHPKSPKMIHYFYKDALNIFVILKIDISFFVLYPSNMLFSNGIFLSVSNQRLKYPAYSRVLYRNTFYSKNFLNLDRKPYIRK